MKKSKKHEITFVTIGGEEISIKSPKLDDFCQPNGDLVLPLNSEKALVIKNWRNTVRQALQ